MTTPAAADSTRSRSRRPHRQLSRMIVLVLLTLAVGVGLAGPASAHNVLISSDPTDGATLQTAPTTVRLTFDQPVQNFQPVITVVGPDGQHYESGSPQVDSTVVSAGVNPLPAAGAYTIAYRVVSADGHPVQGEITFSVADGAAAGGSAGATASDSAAGSVSAGSDSTAGSVSAGPVSAGPSSAIDGVSTAPVTSPTAVAVAPVASSSGLSGWVWAAVAVAAILVAAAIVVILRRPRQPE